MSPPRRIDPAPVARTVHGRGPRHFLLVPGLVPDGPETFWRQHKLFFAHGSVTTLTYPYETFDLDAVVEWITRWVSATRASGHDPVLVGCSVGGGLCLETLRRARAKGVELPLAGLVLVSPFTCVDDLAPLLKRLLKPILEEVDKAGGDPITPYERGRQFFKQLASRALAAGVPEAKGLSLTPAAMMWRSVSWLLIPGGSSEQQEAKVRTQIERTIESIPTHGGMARVVELRRFPGPDSGANADKPLTQAPSLVLWGSKERHTLTMDGPGTGVLCRPDLACRLLPNSEIQWVYDVDGAEVPHASLLKHARAFNLHLRRWLVRTGKPGRQPGLTVARG